MEDPGIDSGALAQLLLDSTGDGIYGVDLDGNCTFANPACVRLLGYESVDELMEIEGMDEKRAAELIMTARAPWFAEEES